MYENHAKGIEKLTKIFENEDSTLAVIIGGSIAHGTAKESSDIDVMIVISDEEFETRFEEKDVWFGYSLEYEEGKEMFIDGKYISKSYIQKVIDFGNEPSRFAFTGAFITYSKIDGLEEMVKKACAYPINKKEDNINRFYSQLVVWRWYSIESVQKKNKYLLNHATNKLVLFAGRLILAHNEILYPYHKWFLHSISKAEDAPENLMDVLNSVINEPTIENIEQLFNLVDKFKKWKTDNTDLTCVFVEDTEFTWLRDKVSIDDI